MKKYLILFICVLTVLFLISENATGSEDTLPFTKVALKYQGETTYRQYDITSVNFTLDPRSNTATYGPTALAILTDESNSLPSGVITEIKFYATDIPGGHAADGWLGNEATFATPDNALNFLGTANVDLSTIMRKKVTVKFYGNSESGNVTMVSPVEENI